MSQNKFSPAPWTETENDEGDVLVRMDESHSVVIANLEGSCGTCHANARLIAAAPELLEALIEVTNKLDEIISDEFAGTRYFDENRIPVIKAQAVIAKAKGEL